MTWCIADHQHMAQALRLARRGLYTTLPNPRVGCVLVKDGAIVGEGWHEYAGGPHAEINALTQAGTQARGATCYVTLEPCCHQGRTPPCTNALISVGVSRVVAAMQDPNPKVRGEGLLALKAAGIPVESGLLETQAREINPGFIKRMAQGLPFVRCKLGTSLDGRVAMATGESRWITSPAARQDVQRLRAQSSAIMTGVGTMLADDPSLTVRNSDIPVNTRPPLRIVLDSHLQTPKTARMLRLPGKTLILTTVSKGSALEELIQAGAEVVTVEATANRKVDLLAALRYLAEREVNEILLEAGPVLTGAMLSAEFIDELVIYMAPKLLGSEARGMAQLPAIQQLTDAVNLSITDLRAVGTDWRVTAKIRQGK
jgi:diaminohydroxyphosphoribosylaminopyrimidine deaminase/5-amino-6-(5-phosphoribosylamino)uracil reductase